MRENNRDRLKLNHSQDRRRRNVARRAIIIIAALLIFGAGIALSLGNILRAAGPPPSAESIWQDVAESSVPAKGEREIIPARYRTVRLDMNVLKTALSKAPMELTEAASKTSLEIAMPMPNGTMGRFKVEESPMMEPGLAAKFPDMKTYQGYGIDDGSATMRFDIGMRGFHAIILSVEGDIFIDPYASDDTEHYISYYKRDLARGDRTFRCFTESNESIKKQLPRSIGPKFAGYGTRYVFRLAMAAAGEYVTAIRRPGDDENQARFRALDAIRTTVNRVNAVFRRDVSIHLVLIANNLDIIYADANLDPYTFPIGTPQVNQQNQENLDEEIGEDNYDIGHVVGTGNGGAASFASACNEDGKAQGSTGTNAPFGDAFDIDFVAHEIGHQFGADHTYNDDVNGLCAGQRNGSIAMEPGSGSTIMGYAGTCDGPGGTAGGNLQQHSDAYFHTISIEAIFFFLTIGEPLGGYCADRQLTGNTIPEFPPPASHTIPARTPFELYAGELVDPNGGIITYCWEEYDVGAPSPPEGDGDGQQRPMFRSYNPSLNPRGSFPSPFYVLNYSNNPPATYQCGTTVDGSPINCITGESLPTRTQTMTFRVTARDQQDGISWQQLQVSVVSTAGPFTILTPSSDVWTKGSRRTVTWNVANTNVAPINCANVKISLSVDDGITFPYVLVGSTPNDGSEQIAVPDVETFRARIKIEAVGNIFFDVSDSSVTIKPIEVTTDADNGSNLAPIQESLREAIIAANSVSGVQTIPFNIPGGGVKTINLTTELPAIEKPIILDGWSQGPPGYSGTPLIELNGAGAGPNSAGLIVNGGNSLIRGIAINRFGNAGLVLQFAGGNRVEGCYIGTNTTGTAVVANGANGISINNIPNNEIGREAPGAENIIAGNNVGIRIIGSNATGNRVMNNYIGTNATGADLGNTLDGIRITDAPGNLIGGTRNAGGILLPTPNVISGNGSGNIGADGIEITGQTASGNMIQGNLIGMAANGTTALGNTGSGVLIDNAPLTKIGGTTGALRNVISGNGGQGGIALIGPNSWVSRIQGNYIGTDVTGNVAHPNNGRGVYVQSGNHTIGGSVAGAGNLISGGGIGIFLEFSGSAGTTIQGNMIGTNAAGTAALNNFGTGIEARGTNNILIGGANSLARNLISGNFTPVSIISCSDVRVQGNYVGTNAAGTAAVPNARGVFIDSSSNITVGGTTAGTGNVISGNGTGFNDRGVNLSNATGSFVQGNLIGTNAAGTAAMGNGLGVLIFGGSGNTIGGPGAARNIISANVTSGVYISGSNGNTVQNNYIGTDITGTTNFGNGQTTGEAGVVISFSNNNTIGGAGAGNIIANSGCFCFGGDRGSGVQVFSGTSNRIEGNSIYGNAELGIDISGGTETLRVTANDDCDADAGPNNLQNFPVLTAAINGTGNVRVEGTLDATASASYNLHFYANPSCDAAGNGEGQIYLGSASVVTAANCIADFSGENGITLAGVTVPAGRVVTATATDGTGNTSEFSACVTVTGVCGVIAPSSQTFPRAGGNGKAEVSAGPECNWTAAIDVSWIVLTSESSGTGSDAVTFEVRENTGGERTGTVTIAEQVLTVTQLGSCVYSINPSLASHPASGGTGSINVQTSNNCIRAAVSNDNWIIITSPNGAGSGVVTYSVTANNGPARVGTITVVGKTFTVKQKPGP